MSGYPWKSITMAVCAGICAVIISISVVILVKRKNYNMYVDDLNTAKEGNDPPVEYWL